MVARRHCGAAWIHPSVVWLAIYALNTFTWKLLLDREGSKVPLVRLFLINVTGFAIDTITPMVALGGEPYKVKALSAHLGTHKSVSAVLLFRMVHTLGHLVMLLAGALPLPHRLIELLRSCELYIGDLKRNGKLISAQPLVRECMLISGTPGQWKETPFDATREVQVGYYHVYAEDLADAIAIAKQNPEFQFGPTASIEVRPIKTKEKTTGFVYPGKKKE